MAKRTGVERSSALDAWELVTQDQHGYISSVTRQGISLDQLRHTLQLRGVAIGRYTVLMSMLLEIKLTHSKVYSIQVSTEHSFHPSGKLL